LREVKDGVSASRYIADHMSFLMMAAHDTLTVALSAFE
jgi:hypothetical protein